MLLQYKLFNAKFWIWFFILSNKTTMLRVLLQYLYETYSALIIFCKIISLLVLKLTAILLSASGLGKKETEKVFASWINYKICLAALILPSSDFINGNLQMHWLPHIWIIQSIKFFYLFIYFLHDDYQEAKTKSLGKVPTSYPDIASLIFILLKQLLSNIYKTVQISQALLQNIYFNVR